MIISLFKKHTWAINLFLVAVLAYILAQIVIDNIKGKMPALPHEAVASSKSVRVENYVSPNKDLASRKSYDIILKRNIFGLKNTSSANSSGIENVPQTTLNLELLGTVINPSKSSVAVIKNVDSGRVNGYKLDELIDIIQSEKVKVIRIENCVAVLERIGEGPETIKCKKDISDGSSSSQVASRTTLNSGSKEARTTKGYGKGLGENADGINQIDEGVYEIDRKMMDELLSNPNDILTKARVVPHDDGLRFFAIRPNSIFSKIGIRNGDTVHSINDVGLDNVENAFSLFEDLKGQSKFSIDLTRRGKRLTYEYTVK
ncbi:MAG TPA: type II secretion system protein GspC [Thermodesulfobacteriota bacterium]